MISSGLSGKKTGFPRRNVSASPLATPDRRKPAILERASEPARLQIERIEAEIGAPLYPAGQPRIAWTFVRDYLRSKSLVIWHERMSPSPEADLALTMDGWQHYEELQRQSSDSRTAFMAMKFGRPRSDAMFRDHFIAAVRATGFELLRLDTRPRAGLIDARMEVDIRTARFLIADLTHGS
jgi:hypothetical protein